MAKTVFVKSLPYLNIIKNVNFQKHFLLGVYKLFYSIILWEVGLHFLSLDDEILTTFGSPDPECSVVYHFTVIQFA